MVKVDPNEDYYAALGCTPLSDVPEVKRKFRALALKYHPDRNPGKEDEFNSKFQVIQAAHEVLTDDAQRAKYDLERARRAARLNDYTSPTRPNVPPRSPATNFPPPPRAPPPPGFKTSVPRSTNTYRQYPRADAATSFPSNGADDNQSKANAFKAWEQMRHGQGPPPTRNAPPKVPPRNPPYRSAPTATAEETPPKEASKRPSWYPQDPGSGMPRRAHTTRVPKKTGFANGDFTAEHSASARPSAYANVARGDRPGVSRPTSVHEPQMPGKDKPDPLRPFKDSAAMSNPLARAERISTPYATSGGEKTYFSSHVFSRTPSGRNSAEMPDAETADDGTHTRHTSHGVDRGHRSASPNFRSPPKPVSISSESSSGSSSEDDRYVKEEARTRKVPISRFKTRNPAGNARVPTFGASVRMDDGNTSNTIHRARTNPTYPNGINIPPPGFTQPPHPPKTAPTEGFAQHRLRRETGQTFPRPQTEHGAGARGEVSHGQPRPMQRPRSWDAKYGAAGATSGVRDPSGETRPAPANHPDRPKIFTFPASNPNQRAHAPPFRSQSSETINTNFSPSKFPAKFTSNPPTPRASREPSRVRTSPVRPQNSDDHRPAESVQAVPVNGNRPPSSGAALDSSNYDQYKNEDWAKHFQPDTHTYPPPPSRSPTRTQTRKRPNTPARPFGPASKRPTAVPQPNGTFSPPDPPGQKPSTSAVDPATEDVTDKNPPADDSAMDIDTPPSRHASDPEVSAARNDLNDRRHSFQAEHIGVIPRPKGPPIPPRPKSHIDSTKVASSATPLAQSRPDSNNLPPDQNNPLNLSSWKSSVPFTASNGNSINNLTDLSASLPFSSRPSEAPTPNPRFPEPGHNNRNDSDAFLAVHQLTPPKPPKGPPVPGGKLTQLSFDRYLASMRTYMTEWNAYNGLMLAHFNARQADAEASMKGEFGGAWMNALGEGGFRSYTRGLEEDVRVREYWDVSWEKHREVMAGLGQVRERVVKGVLL